MPGPDPATIDAAVRAAAGGEPSVIAAYVHGSRARGQQRPTSDLDIALLIEPGETKPSGLEERVAAGIAKATGLVVDVKVIGREMPVLAFEVLDGGRRVLARDPERVDEMEEALLRTYLDTAYLRRVQNHYLLGTAL